MKENGKKTKGTFFCCVYWIALMSFHQWWKSFELGRLSKRRRGLTGLSAPPPPQPSDDDTVSLHSQVSETARADALSLLSKMDHCKGYRK